jgi:hypothetical protein
MKCRIENDTQQITSLKLVLCVSILVYEFCIYISQNRTMPESSVARRLVAVINYGSDQRYSAETRLTKLRMAKDSSCRRPDDDFPTASSRQKYVSWYNNAYLDGEKPDGRIKGPGSIIIQHSARSYDRRTRNDMIQGLAQEGRYAIGSIEWCDTRSRRALRYAGIPLLPAH